MNPSTDHHEQQRQRIIGAATRAFHANGIKNVTMDDIAHMLTMSKRTLYQTFADKQELLLACIEQHDHEKEAMMQELLQSRDNVLEFLLTTLAQNLDEMRHIKPAFFAEVLKYPKVMDYFARKRREQEADAVSFLNKGIEQGYFRSDVNFTIVYAQLSEGLSTMMRNEVLMSFTQVEVFRNTVLVYLRGCATMKGIGMIDSFLDKYKDQLAE